MNQKQRTVELHEGVLYINCCSCGKILPAEENFKKTKKGTSYMSDCKKCLYARNNFNRLKKRAEKRGISITEMMEERATEEYRKQMRMECAGMDATEARGGMFKANICFGCKNACGGCSWTAVDNTLPGKPIRFEPVPGWTAEPVYRNVSKQLIKTYAITACPQFVPDRREK